VSYDKRRHLDEDQLIRAIVDRTDLHPADQAHLASCTYCMNSKAVLDEKLDRLGMMAKQRAGAPRKRILISERTISPVSASFGHWKALSSFAATAAVVILALFLGLPPSGPQHNGIPELTLDQLLEEEQFMAEITDLSENALPASYLGIIAESDDVEAEEFLDFIVPDPDVISRLPYIVTGGNTVC